MAKKIVITGGAGFIGSNLGCVLHNQGYEVLLIDNMSFGYKENLTINNQTFGKFIEDDIRSDSIFEHIKGADCVFHLAAISALPVCQSDPYLAIDVNVAGTAKVLEAARKAGVRKVVFASTSAIYENNKNYPCFESDDTDPTLIYSVSKKQAEMLCLSYVRDYNMDVTITRYYNVYGPNQDMSRKSPPFVAYLIREFLSGRQPILHSDGNQERDYVHVSDVNAINIACMNNEKSKGQIFNVASGKSYSVKKMVDIIKSGIGTDILPIYRDAGKFWDKYPELFEGKYSLDISKVQSEVNKFTLGNTQNAKNILNWWAKISIEDGLQETIEVSKKQLQSFSV
jgi:UDP-glucose 4-epimerase